jgi:hypothetical protein
MTYTRILCRSIKRTESLHKTPLNNSPENKVTEAAMLHLLSRGSSFESGSVVRLPWVRFYVVFHTASSKIPT